MPLLLAAAGVGSGGWRRAGLGTAGCFEGKANDTAFGAGAFVAGTCGADALDGTVGLGAIGAGGADDAGGTPLADCRVLGGAGGAAI